jgi:hypothetical protein
MTLALNKEKYMRNISLMLLISITILLSQACQKQQSTGKKIHLGMSTDSVVANKPFEVAWVNTPGNQQDWITLVPVGTPDNRWGQWTYLKNRTAGSYKFSAPKSGDYEVRLYYDWPAGGFEVIERLRVSVSGPEPQVMKPPQKVIDRPSEPYLSMEKTKYKKSEEVKVSWANTPGNKQDWITIVPKETPDNHWKKWTYLKGETFGSFSVANLNPGKYEARLYFNWPAGRFNVIERMEFVVE